jgi:hypothetical protein
VVFTIRPTVSVRFSFLIDIPTLISSAFNSILLPRSRLVKTASGFVDTAALVMRLFNVFKTTGLAVFLTSD